VLSSPAEVVAVDLDQFARLPQRVIRGSDALHHTSDSPSRAGMPGPGSSLLSRTRFVGPGAAVVSSLDSNQRRT